MNASSAAAIVSVPPSAIVLPVLVTWVGGVVIDRRDGQRERLTGNRIPLTIVYIEVEAVRRGVAVIVDIHQPVVVDIVLSE